MRKVKAKHPICSLLVVAAMLMACGGGGDSNSGSDTALATITLGTQGGTLRSVDNIVSVFVPDGALLNSTTISIVKTEESSEVGARYEFGPPGIAFLKPVIVKFSYREANLPAGVDESNLFVATTDEYIEILDNIQVDTTNKTISGEARHFSTYEIGTYKSTGVKFSDFKTTATTFRMPIGDTGAGQDVGANISLLSTASWTNFSYPKISFNVADTSNSWYVTTAFNQMRWLNNGWSEPSPSTSDKFPCKSEDLTTSIYLCTPGIPPFTGANAPIYTYHPGEDWNRFGTDKGLPVRAIADGIVLFSQSQKTRKLESDPWKSYSFGNIVVVGHKLPSGSIVASVYAHLRDIPTLKAGDIVSRGATIGKIGDSGAAAGAPHLHFEVTKENSALLRMSQNLGETGLIYLPSIETSLKVGGWYWPGSDTNFIAKNYQDPSSFVARNSNTQSNVYTVNATADTYIRSSRSQADDYGLDADYVEVGGWGDWYYGFWKFDIAALPQIIKSATVRLYVTNSESGQWTYPELSLWTLAGSWSEGMQWQQNATTAAFKRNIGRPAGLGWFEFDVTDIYRSWKSGTLANDGIQLRSLTNVANAVYFASSESTTTARRPVLVVKP